MNGIRGGDNESGSLYMLSETVHDLFYVRNMFLVLFRVIASRFRQSRFEILPNRNPRPVQIGGCDMASEGQDMRGVVMFAIMFAIMAVIDAAFFKGKYLDDAQTSITGLAGISTQIGKR